MVRAISIFGFGALFLLVSPEFRGNVMNGISLGYGSLEKYSPWSYVACAVIGLIFIGFTINRGSRPR